MPEENCNAGTCGRSGTFTSIGAAQVHMCPNCKIRDTPPPEIPDTEKEKPHRGLPRLWQPFQERNRAAGVGL